MSQLGNHSRLDSEQTPFKKVLFALSCIPFVFPPAFWLLYMAARIRPAKFKGKWVLCSLLTIIFSVYFVYFGLVLSAPLIAYIPAVILAIYVYKNHVYEEYVIYYNALIDSGYFTDKERTREADLHLWEKEIMRDAERRAEELTHKHKPKGEYVSRPKSGKKNIPEKQADLEKEKKTETKSETQKQAEARVEEVLRTRPTEKHKEEKSSGGRTLDFKGS